jgi:hypothetical protein
MPTAGAGDDDGLGTGYVVTVHDDEDLIDARAEQFRRLVSPFL